MVCGKALILLVLLDLSAVPLKEQTAPSLSSNCRPGGHVRLGAPAVWVNFSVFDCFLVVFLSEVRKTKFLNEAVKQQQQEEEEERAVCGVVRGYRIWDRLTFITRRTAASLGQSWASRTDSFTEEDVELELFKGRGKGRKYQAGGGKFIFFSQDCELLDYWL